MAILLKSLIAALVTAIILLITNYSGPKLAGAIGGIPIVFAVSYILVTVNNKIVSRDFLMGGGIRGHRRHFFQSYPHLV